MGTVLSTKIKDYYDQQLNAQKSAITNSAEASKQPYLSKLSQASSVYDPMKNDAYTQNVQAQKSLRERMTNMGFGATGGTSLRKETDLSNQFQKNLANIGLQKQNYINEQNDAIKGIDAQTANQIANAEAQNRLDMQNALTAQENTDIANALNLFLAGKITKAQYRSLTGMVI